MSVFRLQTIYCRSTSSTCRLITDRPIADVGHRSGQGASGAVPRFALVSPIFFDVTSIEFLPSASFAARSLHNHKSITPTSRGYDVMVLWLSASRVSPRATAPRPTQLAPLRLQALARLLSFHPTTLSQQSSPADRSRPAAQQGRRVRWLMPHRAEALPVR